MSEPVASPCIRQCTLSGDGVCIGCFRHIDEIVAWSSMGNEARRDVLVRCEQRRGDPRVRTL